MTCALFQRKSIGSKISEADWTHVELEKKREMEKLWLGPPGYEGPMGDVQQLASQAHRPAASWFSKLLGFQSLGRM